MKVRIRRALLDDSKAISAILMDLGWFDHLNDESPEVTERQVQRHLTRCFADNSHSTYVAETYNGEIVGYAAVHWLPYLFLPGPEGYLSELFVSESVRGQGVGSKLLHIIEEEARALGCCRLMLITSRNRESYTRGFYRKSGWDERELIRNFVLPLAPDDR
jgi:GNAT superfamily N-acetyltransferase